MIGDIRPDEGRVAVDEIVAAGGDVSYVQCDVSDESEVAEAVSAAAERMGGIDGVVAAAGISTRGPIHDLSLHDWNLVIGVNLTGVFLVLRECLSPLMEAGGGAIVTIGSVSSTVIGAGGSAGSYKASKGAVLQLTKEVAVAYAEEGIRANCVCPGAVATNIREHSMELAARTTTRSEWKQPRIVIEPPVKRAADPSEIGSVVTFLLSDDASFMTGSAVYVDGGYTAI